MDDKEIKNDLPGPVSHFSAQACRSPSSSLSHSHTLSPRPAPPSPLPPPPLPVSRHVTTPHDYWRNHSCNSLPSFPWGLRYLSLSLPQVLRHCLGNCMCKARDACDPLRQGSRRCEGAHHAKKKKNSSLMCPIMCPSKSHK